MRKRKRTNITGLVLSERNKIMRRLFIGLLCLCAVLLLPACQPGGEEGASGQSSTSSLVPTEDVLETTAGRDLFGGQTNFYYLNLTEDTTATLRYTYSTKDAAGAQLGYASEGGEPSMIELPAASDAAYNVIWQEKEISLKAGENVFSLTGDSVHCLITMQLEGVDEDAVLHAGLLPMVSSGN